MHDAAVAVHDRLGHAGGAGRIDDPQRMVERHATAARSRRVRLPASRAQRGAARSALPAQAPAQPQVARAPAGGAPSAHGTRAGRPTAARRRSCATASRGRTPCRRSDSRRTAISTFGSIWRKRSSTRPGPCPARSTRPDRADAGAWRGRRRWSAGCWAGRPPRGRRGRRPARAACARVPRPATPSSGQVSSASGCASPAWRIAGALARPRLRAAWRKHLLRIVQRRALEPARARHLRRASTRAGRRVEADSK